MRFSTTFITTVLLALATSPANAAQIGSAGPSALRQTAQTVNNAANGIQHDAQTARKAVGNLLQVFHGGSASTVQQQLAKADAGVRQAVKVYQEIVSTLNQAAQ